MRVQDGCVPVADEPAERSDCGSVGTGGQLTLQDRQVQIRHSELVGDVLHRTLARRDRPGDHEHLVSTPLLPGGQFEHGQGRSTDVQPRDRVDDPHKAFGCLR
jgi:hypothetical protein